MAFLAAASLALAQGPGHMVVHDYRAAEGLPEGLVEALIQDHLGRYWVAAEHGIYVGDGSTFLRIPTGVSGERPQFQALAEDGAGRIQALGESGFFILEGVTWRRDSTNLPPRPPHSPAALFKDGAGGQWMQWGAHLFQAEPSGRWVELALPSSAIEAMSPRPKAPGIFVREGPRAWVREGASWRALPDLPLRVGEEFRAAVQEDAHGALWAATYQRLLRLDPGGSAWTSVADPEGNEGYAGSLSALGAGELWAMGNRSARRLDRTEASLATSPTFSVFAMRLLLRDREGALWADRNGLHRLGGRWRLHVGDGLPTLGAWQALRDPAGHLWLSTTEGLYCHRDGRWKLMWKTGLHSQIALGADGRIWAVEQTSGRILRFDARRGDAAPEPPLPALLGVQAIRGISAGGGRIAIPGRDGRIHLGTWEGGAWNWQILAPSLQATTLRTFGDPAGHLHLTGISPTHEVLLSVDGGPWATLPMANGHVPTDLLLEADGRLRATQYTPPSLQTFARTQTGWSLAEQVDLETFSPCTAAYGLARLPDGRLWITTDHGVLELDPKQPERARHFTTQEGLPLDDCNQFGLLVEPDRVWVSTGTGLASYDRRDEPPRPDLPGPILLGARIDEAPWTLGLAGDLPAGTRALNLLMGVPSPALKPHLRYQWRDLERGGAWQAFDGPTLSFLDPAPGPHRIQVRCLEPGSHASPEWGLVFRVARPWWRQPGMLALWGLLAAGLGLLFHRLRLAAIERRNGELARMVEERTAALAASEERERAASRAKSAFLADMSHELRTPLNAMLLYSELIQQDATESGQADIARDSGRLLASGQHLISLLNGILDLSKIEAGKMEVNLDSLPLRVLLEEVIATLRPLAEKQRDVLVLEQEGELWLQTDGLKLKQVFLNLAGNAIKFTEGGTITLAARSEGSEIHLEVRDTGMGLHPDQVARLFLAYEQPAQSAGARATGTGLGLTISKKFIELLGGRIEVVSVPREGTTFHIWLPLKVEG
jgi:signal transduction histidine kinase